MYRGSINKILFLDIETVPQQSEYNTLDESWKELWDTKSRFLIRDKTIETPGAIYERAGIYAEFGKIICISCGYINKENILKIKSFSGDDEKELLHEFCELLDKHFNTNDHSLCAHNGKEFDFPYLCRRIIINKLSIPEILNIAGKKPWETNLLDTMELWRFGDFKNFTSLNLLAKVLNLPSPKDDIDGSMVWKVYWLEKDLKRIVDYCQKDVITLTQIFLRLNGNEALKDVNVESV